MRDAALVCATLIEGGGGNDLDWNKMSPLCNLLKSNLALGGLKVQHYRIFSICSTDSGARRISSFSKMPMMSFCTLNSEKKTIYETVISGLYLSKGNEMGKWYSLLLPSLQYAIQCNNGRMTRRLNVYYSLLFSFHECWHEKEVTRKWMRDRIKSKSKWSKNRVNIFWII